MLSPSKVEVPRPISSRTTRLRDVAVCRMLAVSCISTMNVDCPRAMLSDAPTLAKMRSTIGSFASLAGTNEPICASSGRSAVCRRYVDLPPMFGPGEDHELPGRAVEVDVVGHERAGRESLDHGMAGVGDEELVTLVHVRFRVVRDGGGFRQGRQDVECGQRAGRVLNPRRLRADAGSEPLEDLELALEDSFVGAEHLRLILLERRRGEALAARDRLLALVVSRHGVQVRLRDLDVVAEHAVEANLERADAGARPFAAPPSRR